MDSFDSIVVEIQTRGVVGRGEALGAFYLGETPESLLQTVESIGGSIEAGIDRSQLQQLLPPGGARNAVDCALWDLEAKLTGRSIWELTGVEPRPLQTVFSIGLESSVEAMAAKAAAAKNFRQLKIKLDADAPLERVSAIRAQRPDADIIVDANQAWTHEQLTRLAPDLAALGVQMIEQPLPRGNDEVLEDYRSPVPLCADESCLHMDELDAAADRYQLINIKLDKTGGLTHALELARAARSRGLGLMVGCMAGSSLSMAPAFVIGCLSDRVDIDGPLLQRCDRIPGLRYESGEVSVFGPDVWG
jgi:L-alanine-DL-glutamate epimerase-like enolase superfamily enzyme